MEFISDTGDHRRFSITAWGNKEISALDQAVATGALPYCVRSQDYRAPGKKLAGRSYYFHISSAPGNSDGLEMAINWLDSRARKEV